MMHSKVKYARSPDWDGGCPGDRSDGAPGECLLTIWTNFCTCWEVFCRAVKASFAWQNKSSSARRISPHTTHNLHCFFVRGAVHLAANWIKELSLIHVLNALTVLC